MKEEVIKLNNYNLHIIRNKKYKNIGIDVIFINNLDKQTSPSRCCLFDLLGDSNLEYNTRIKMNKYCEELYNVGLYSSLKTFGGYSIGNIGANFLDPKYVDEESFAEQIIKFLFDIIFKPNIVDNKFDQVAFDAIKHAYKINNIRRFEKPANIACYEAYKLFDSNGLINMLITGTNEEIDNITNDSILNEYNKMLNEDQVEIFMSGNITDEMIELVKKYAVFNNHSDISDTLYIGAPNVSEIKDVTKSSNYSQSNLFMIYNTNGLSDFETNYVVNVLDQILGGGMDSILFNEVREKNSLCYVVRSNYDRFSKNMYIYTGIDKDNINQARELILSIMNNLKSYINEEELNKAKIRIKTEIKGDFDSNNSIISSYIRYTIGHVDLMDERVKKYDKVSLEDIYNVLDKIKLNTIYCLRGDLNGEN